MKTEFVDRLRTEEFKQKFLAYYKVREDVQRDADNPRVKFEAELVKPGALANVYDEVVADEHLQEALEYEQEIYGYACMMEWFYCRFDNAFVDSIF